MLSICPKCIFIVLYALQQANKTFCCSFFSFLLLLYLFIIIFILFTALRPFMSVPPFSTAPSTHEIDFQFVSHFCAWLTFYAIFILSVGMHTQHTYIHAYSLIWTVVCILLLWCCNWACKAGKASASAFKSGQCSGQVPLGGANWNWAAAK